MKVAIFFALCLNICLATIVPGNIYSSQNDEARLRLALFEKYDRDIMPEHNTSNPVGVSVSLSVVAIKGIDVRAQAVEIEGWVLFSWNDSRLAWNPQEYGGMNVLRVGVKKMWKPDVTLYNSANFGVSEFVEGSKTKNTVVYSTGQVLWVPAASIKAFCDLDLTRYPYDTHTCSFKFGSWVYDGYNLDLQLKGGFLSDSMDLSDLRNNSEWKVVANSVVKESKYYPCCPEPYPAILFNLTLSRHNPVYQAAIVTPVTAGILLSVISFVASPFNNRRLLINAFNLMIFLLTLFHLQYQLPSVGDNTPSIVLISEGMVLLLTLSMAWSVVATAISKRCKRSQPPQFLNRFLSSWPTKVLLISNGNESMNDCFKKISELNHNGKDPETVAIVTEEQQKYYSGWIKFILVLDRLAFVFFIVFATVLGCSYVY